MLKIGRILLVIFLVCIFLFQANMIQASFPEEAIIFIVPYDPGGGVDAIARSYQGAAESFGVEVRPDYHPGASGVIGMNYLIRQQNDGYTIGLQNDINMIGQIITGMAPFSLDDFTFIGQIALDPNVFATAKDYESLEEVIEIARQEPLSIDVGTAGPMSETHVIAAATMAEAGVEFNFIHYASGAEMSAGVLGEEVDIGVGGFAPFAGSMGELNLLAVSSAERSEILPDTPTLKELGIDFSLEVGRTLLAPAGLDAEIREKLEELSRDIAAQDEFKEALIERRGTPAWRGAQETEEQMYQVQELIYYLIDEYDLTVE